MIAVCSALILGALPFFMMGGLAVQAKDDLGFSEAALGLAVTIGFLTGAVSAPFTGRVADRIGAKRAVYLGCALSAASMMGIASSSEFTKMSWPGVTTPTSRPAALAAVCTKPIMR